LQPAIVFNQEVQQANWPFDFAFPHSLGRMLPLVSSRV
jgi:hypothetical protein